MQTKLPPVDVELLKIFPINNALTYSAEEGYCLIGGLILACGLEPGNHDIIERFRESLPRGLRSELDDLEVSVFGKLYTKSGKQGARRRLLNIVNKWWEL